MTPQLRHGIAIVGFVLAAGGVALDNRWMVWAAIALLAVSLLLRLLARTSPPQQHD